MHTGTDTEEGIKMPPARKRLEKCFLAVIAAMGILIPACSRGDEKLAFHGTEIIFDGLLVGEEQAGKLGTYLMETGFADGSPKTVEFAKSGSIWQFKMVVQDQFLQNPEHEEIAAVFAAQLSRDVLRGEQVEIHFCNAEMNTIKIVQAQKSLSQSVVIDQTEIFFDGENVTRHDAEKLGSYLEDVDFIDGVPKSIKIAREGSVWQFKIIVSAEYLDHPEYTEIYKEFAKQVSEDFYDSAPVEIHLCNDFFVTKQVVGLDRRQ